MYKIPATSLFLGQNQVFLTECHSTNDYALKLCQESQVPEGTLVITPNQTGGRGQRGNSWISAPGENLTFSLVLYPSFLTAGNQFALTMAIANGLVAALQGFGLNATIKWPNDILVNRKKIAGILLENVLRGDQVFRTIAGIGLNVNQLQFSLPHATSLALEIGQSCDLMQVLGQVLQETEASYLRLRGGGRAAVEPEYRDSLFGLHESVVFTRGTHVFTGEILGVDAHGRLEVMLDSGEQQAFTFQEIRYGYGYEDKSYL